MDEKQEDFKTQIDELSHEDMCRMWRFGNIPAQWRDSTNPASKYFQERLFQHFGGFTPEISKRIGW